MCDLTLKRFLEYFGPIIGILTSLGTLWYVRKGYLLAETKWGKEKFTHAKSEQDAETEKYLSLFRARVESREPEKEVFVLGIDEGKEDDFLLKAYERHLVENRHKSVQAKNRLMD